MSRAVDLLQAIVDSEFDPSDELVDEVVEFLEYRDWQGKRIRGEITREEFQAKNVRGE